MPACQPVLAVLAVLSGGTGAFGLVRDGDGVADADDERGSGTDVADLRARQADTAEVLAALLREYAVPPIGWRINSFDGSPEGRIYRESADAALADLTTVAELLGTEVGEHAPESGTDKTQLLVRGHHHRTPITVYGQVTVIGAE